MLQKFVYWTGMSDFLVGAATWAGIFVSFNADMVVALVTLGTFLMMAAACLMWASFDIKNRSPIIFWQGLVRLSAAIAVVVMVVQGLQHPGFLGLTVFDGTIGLVYIIGSMKVTGLSFFEQLMCKSPAN